MTTIDILSDLRGKFNCFDEKEEPYYRALSEAITALTADVVEVVRCKDCKHQEKYFYADKRLKDGGRYTYGCDLADGYSHVCLDDDFCSRGERKDGRFN